MLSVPLNNQNHGQSSYSSDDLPRNVVMSLPQGSAVKSMDFHPKQPILLLVGTNTGDVMVWELITGKKVAFAKFKVWSPGQCTVQLQENFLNDQTASINRVMWSPDGTLFGVAYSKHLVHLFSYTCSTELRNPLEIDAHVGSVNDLAFSYPGSTQLLCIVTCGEDRLIKVWNATTGAKQATFQGHEAPVYSVCPHHKENTQFIFSTATDGKIKAWTYDDEGPRVTYDAPVPSSTTMACSSDGTRLFSCGTNKEGESFLVEWNESEGAVKRRYLGLGKQSVGVVQLDTTKNRFLAVGDEFLVKFWDMDSEIPLTTIDADGGLPVFPCIRFNKDGTLLAVSTSENSVKVLANTLGKPKAWTLPEINESSQCSSLRLPESISSAISRLIYSNNGFAILALLSNAEHKLWKWTRIDRGKASASIAPQFWQPPNGIIMTNDLSETNPEDAVSCLALSKNDSYVMSASGGKISLFNMITFKTMTTFMPAPPAASFLAFHPQDNNIMAIGMEDSTIQIYNVRVDEVKTKLKGHRKRITCLAFSNALNVLVSSGADGQLCVWSMDGWEKLTSKFLQVMGGNSFSDIKVQFHQDQTHMLVVHSTQIAIYEAPKLECLKQWVPQERGPITHATYACDSQSIYVSFEDGSISVLTAPGLRLRCRINPSAYLSPNTRAYPNVIAAHPSEPNQFALGLTDGGVYVLEPLESEGQWGMAPPPENSAGTSAAPGAVVADQPQR